MAADVELTTLVLADGRVVDLALAGDPAAPAVVFHHGTPQARETWAPLVEAVLAHGWRWVSRSRPGYGGSSRRAWRTVAQDARDTEEVLDALGVDRFVAMGWSGGGPHALACGALLAGRCDAVVAIAGVAPFVDWPGGPAGWLAGMGEENHEEYGAAQIGEGRLRAWLEAPAAALATVTGEQVAGALGDLVDAPDRDVLVGGYADAMAGTFRESVAHGVDGWVDDDVAFIRPWGFELADVAVPVAVWQGDADRMVPFAHGQRLAAGLPDVRAHLLPGEGHLSVAVGRFPEMVAEAVGFSRSD